MNTTTFYKTLIFDFILLILFLLSLSYYLNNRFCKRHLLNDDILKFKFHLIKKYFGGIMLGCLLIFTIWTIFYLIYPFEIIKSPDSTVNPVLDIITYSLGNTLEELLFRVFLLLASVKLFGRIGGILTVSLLFGFFYLQGTGLTTDGLSIVLTTFTMSLLFISVIYYTQSLWLAVTLHITANLLLHTLGFDGTNDGLFQLRFSTTNINEHSTALILIYEIIILAFVLLIFIKGRKRKI